jgi:hypothetical protein
MILILWLVVEFMGFFGRLIDSEENLLGSLGCFGSSVIGRQNALHLRRRAYIPDRAPVVLWA